MKHVSKFFVVLMLVCVLLLQVVPVAMGMSVPSLPANQIDYSRKCSVEIWKLDETVLRQDDTMSAFLDSTATNGQVNSDLVSMLEDMENAPVLEGVVFKYVRLGDIVQYSYQNASLQTVSVLLYGVDAAHASVLTTLGLNSADAYDVSKPSTNGWTPTAGTLYFSGEVLSNAMNTCMTNTPVATKNALEAYMNSSNVVGTCPATDATGFTRVDNLDIGLYLFTENFVPESVTTTTNPFILSLPMTTLSGNGATGGTAWQYDVVVYPKNLTSIPTFELTVRESAASGGTNASLAAVNSGYSHNAVVSTGDALEYQMVSKIPEITSTGTYFTAWDYQVACIGDAFNGSSYANARTYTEVAGQMNSVHFPAIAAFDGYSEISVPADVFIPMSAVSGNNGFDVRIDSESGESVYGNGASCLDTNGDGYVDRISFAHVAAHVNEWYVLYKNERNHYDPQDVRIEVFSAESCQPSEKLLSWSLSDATPMFTVDYTNFVDYSSTSGVVYNARVNTMTIRLTAAGLNALNTYHSGRSISASGEVVGLSGKYLRVTFSTTQSDNVVLGDVGNPTTGTLSWKRTNTDYVDSVSDHDHIYSYQLWFQKTFSGDGDFSKVTFIIENVTEGGFVAVSQAGRENPHMATQLVSRSNASVLTPDANGDIVIHGLEDGQYNIHELTTDEGYAPLSSPITVVISTAAASGLCNENPVDTIKYSQNNTLYADYENYRTLTHSKLVASATTNGNAVEMSPVVYGTLDNVNQMSQHASVDGIVVHNTTTFNLPRTGGQGFVMMVFSGVFGLCVTVALVALVIKQKRFLDTH